MRRRTVVPTGAQAWFLLDFEADWAGDPSDILPDGIPSVEAFGAPTVSGVVVAPGGVPPPERGGGPPSRPRPVHRQRAPSTVVVRSATVVRSERSAPGPAWRLSSSTRVGVAKLVPPPAPRTVRAGSRFTVHTRTRVRVELQASSKLTPSLGTTRVTHRDSPDTEEALLLALW